MKEVAGVYTLGRHQRHKSRIPTATAKMARSVSESELGTESVDERLETLLHLLGGSRQGSAANR